MKLKLDGKHNLEIEKFAEKVQPLYQHLNWTWSMNDKVPSTQDIIDSIYELIDLAKGKTGEISIGGLAVEIVREELTNEDDFVYLQIKFVLDENLYNVI